MAQINTTNVYIKFIVAALWQMNFYGYHFGGYGCKFAELFRV